MRYAGLMAASLLGLLAALGGLATHVRNRSVPAWPEADPAAAAGSFHVHSELSHDSDVPLAALIDAAKHDRLSFLVLTDHNEQYAGPMVRDGITLLSYAELSTA